MGGNLHGARAKSSSDPGDDLRPAGENLVPPADEAATRFADVDIHEEHELVSYAVEARMLRIPGTLTDRFDVLGQGTAKRRSVEKGFYELRNQPLQGSGSAGRQIAELVDRYANHENPADQSHVASFYDTFDPSSVTELLEATLYESLIAAGPCRSKPEAILRGRAAASMVQAFRDDVKSALAREVGPPWDVRQVREWLARTSRDLMVPVVMPPASGGVAAVRHLAAIGDIALTHVDRYLLGDGVAHAPGAGAATFPPPCGWRAARVLTRIGQILTHAGPKGRTGNAVYGDERVDQISEEADRILGNVFDYDPPILYRSRSLPIEAARYLLRGQPKYTDELLRRAAEGTTQAEPNRLPFGESGAIPPRERMFSALVGWERGAQRWRSERAPGEKRQVTRWVHDDGLEIVKRLRAAIDEVPKVDARVHVAGREAIAYAASYLELINELGRHPQLSELLQRELPEAVFVRRALHSTADDHKDAWSQESKWARFVTPADDPTARILEELPFHARHATRSLVMQTLLTIDGAARRSAIEAIRRASHQDVAARLYMKVIDEYERHASPGGAERTRLSQWVLDVALFCLEHTGSMRGLYTLMHHAGLRTPKHGEASREARIGTNDAWLRATALFGVGDLADTLHDQEPHFGDAGAATKSDQILTAVDRRLMELWPTIRTAGMANQTWVGSRSSERYNSDGLCYQRAGTELRALTYVLTMLRSPDPRSLRLLHVLSGRYAQAEEPPEVLRFTADHNATLEEDTGWAAWIAARSVLQGPTLDLMTWQLAEWGLRRIEVRFVEARANDGVRLVDPLHAAQTAELRLRAMSTTHADPVWHSSELDPEARR